MASRMSFATHRMEVCWKSQMREARPGNASHLQVTTQQPEPGPLPLSINNVQNVAVLADGPSCLCGLVGAGILRPIDLMFDFQLLNVTTSSSCAAIGFISSSSS